MQETDGRKSRSALGLPSGDNNSFQTVLADFSGNLEIELLDCVPLLNQIDVLLARKFFVKHFPHLHASLDVEHQLGYFILFHTGSCVSESFKYSLDPTDQLIHGLTSEIQIDDRIRVQFVFGRVTREFTDLLADAFQLGQKFLAGFQ
jgi:hypothetical protein